MDKLGESLNIGASGGDGKAGPAGAPAHLKYGFAALWLIIKHSFCGGPDRREENNPQTSSCHGWVGQNFMSKKAERLGSLRSGNMLIPLEKKNGAPPKAGMLSPTPCQHAEMPSELGRVSGKAPSDLHHRDFQKIKTINSGESWAPGHRVCSKTWFAASSSLHVTSATTQSNPHHNPSAVDAALVAHEKRSLPQPSIPLCLSFPPNPHFQAGKQQEPSPRRLPLPHSPRSLRVNRAPPMHSQNATSQKPAHQKPQRSGFVQWGIPHSLPRGKK